MILLASFTGAYALEASYTVVDNSPPDLLLDAGIAFPFERDSNGLGICLNYGAFASLGSFSFFIDHTLFNLMQFTFDSDNGVEAAFTSELLGGAAYSIPLPSYLSAEKIKVAEFGGYSYYLSIPSKSYQSIDIRAGYGLLSAPIVHNVFLSGQSYDLGWNASAHGPFAGLAYTNKKFIVANVDGDIRRQGDLWQAGFDVQWAPYAIMTDQASTSSIQAVGEFTYRAFAEFAGRSGNNSFALYCGLGARPPFVISAPYVERPRTEASWKNGIFGYFGLNLGYMDKVFNK
jgi:hypothetical protein